MRTEPPMSLPWAIGPIPVTTAAPAPPLEPPAESAGSRGFRVRPCSALSAKMRIEKAGVLVRPIITAPARLRLATTGLSAAAILSRKATTPLSVGQRASAARLAAALGAENIRLGRHRMEGVSEERRILGARQGVVHVGAGQELTRFVVNHVFAQGLADALDDAAMRLAVDQERVDHGAEIVDE